MPEAAYPDGLEFLWIAMDRIGQVGAFVSAGEGPIPVCVLDSALYHLATDGSVECATMEVTEPMIWHLPRISGWHPLLGRDTSSSTTGYAERGIYLFDWLDHEYRPDGDTNLYEQTAAPTHPLYADGLPDPLKAMARLVELRNLTFERGIPVDIRSTVQCAERGW